MAYSATEILPDGTPIHLREIRPNDKPRLLEHFSALSVNSAHLRFFSPKRHFSDRELAAFTELDFDRSAALVATIIDGGRERIVGLVQYVTVDGPPPSAEIACSVIDDYQGRGIGALLLGHLLHFARRHGIERFAADVLRENEKMLGLFEQSGLAKHRSLDSGVVHLTFSGEEVDHFLAAA